MPNHKKFDSDGEEVDQPVSNSKRSSDGDRDRQRERDREKRRHDGDRDHRRRGEDRDRSERRDDRKDRKNDRDRDDKRAGRDWQERGGDRRNEERRDRRDDNERRREKPNRDELRDERKDRDEAPGAGGEPTWANSRVKEHAEKLKERKMIWQAKRDKPEEAEPGTSTPVDEQAKKNMGMWSSAIAASGVADAQAEKFKRLLGFKGDAAKQKPAEAPKSEELKQKNLLSSLDKQFNMAREASNTARGMGLGYH
ncbi:unnamed protein product, partial [Mesorhabditis spiculigera]